MRTRDRPAYAQLSGTHPNPPSLGGNNTPKTAPRTRLITARVLLVPNSATLAWSSSRGAPLATAAEM